MKATARELLDSGLWQKVCEIEGINPWAISEGLMAEQHEIELSDSCVRSLLDLQRWQDSDPATEASGQPNHPSDCGCPNCRFHCAL